MKELMFIWENKTVRAYIEDADADIIARRARLIGYLVPVPRLLVDGDPDRRPVEEKALARQIVRQLDQLTFEDCRAIQESLEVNKCPDGLLPDGNKCPRCGGNRGTSGIGGGTWVHVK